MRGSAPAADAPRGFAAPRDGCGPALALLWVEPLPGQVAGRAGLPAGGGGGGGGAAPDGAATWLAPPARAPDGGVGAYAATLSLATPGRYSLGVFVDGALVGAPFTVTVLPAPPAAPAR